MGRKWREEEEWELAWEPKGHSHRDRDLQSLWNQGKSFHKAMVCYAMAVWLSPDLPSDSERSLC